MTFLWPVSLSALALIPLLIVLFVWRQRRRRRFAVRYSSLSLVRAALPSQSRYRRYLPMALFLLALAALSVALARPVTVTQVPSGRATVMLSLDVSGSMNQRDIPPSRLLAAKQAAYRFIDRQKGTNQVGVVAFAGYAELVQAPTTDGNKLKKAVQVLTTARRTAIGEGILTALHTITDFDASAGGPAIGASPVTSPDGQFRPDIIVLLTDGVSNAGTDPLEAAQAAADAKVRVYTIGYGTQNGSAGQFGQDGGGQGFGQGRGGRGGGGFFGGRNFGIDEQSLKAIATMTGGEYYTAASADELQKVFDNLPLVLSSKEQTIEISVAFAALAAVLVVGALLLSQLWQPLP